MQIETKPERLAYSLVDAAAALSIGKSSVYNLIKSGKLSARKVGTRTIVTAASVRALIEGEAA